MTRLSVNQAARAGYASRAVIYRKVKQGELHSEAGERGEVVIDTAELTRVFGDPDPQRGTSREPLIEVSETAQLRAENTLLRAENADLRLQRDRLMNLLERTALSPHPRPGAGVLSRVFRRRRGTEVTR